VRQKSHPFPVLRISMKAFAKSLPDLRATHSIMISTTKETVTTVLFSNRGPWRGVTDGAVAAQANAKY
jgi:hypothetical protein